MRSLIKVAGGVVKGRSHEINKSPCQDKFYVCKEKNKQIAGIALADGAGSCKFSHIGAEFTVKNVLPYIKENFDLFINDHQKAESQIINFLLCGLSNIAQSNEIAINELACTMLFIQIRNKKNTIEYLAGHIGDGVIFYEEEKKVKLLSEPENGEFANSTIFVTSKNSNTKLRIYSGVLRKPTGFMIMSDGTAETLYIKKTKEPNQTYCQQIFNWCNKYSQEKITKALEQNLQNGIFRDVSSDDCSLCLLKVT